MTKTNGVLLAAGLAAVGALPAAAQTGLCGGVGATGQWIGGSEAASDVSTAGAAMEQMALVLMRNEYVALFSVSAPTEVRIEAQGRGGGDPVIDLRDAAGTILLSDDDSGGDGASRAETSLQPGTYCVSMKSYDGAPMTGFVRVGRTDQEALTTGTSTAPTEPTTPTDDPNNTGGSGQAPGEVCDLNRVTAYLGDGSIDAALSAGGATATNPIDQVAYYGFTLDAPSPISITAENPDADPVVTLYDATGNYLGENDDFDGLNSRLEMTSALQPGEYCVALRALSDASLPVTVSVMAYDPIAALEGMYERGEASPPLDGTYPVTDLGTLGTRLRQDVNTTDVSTWFSFTVEQGGLVLVEAVSNEQGDPIMVMYDDFGRKISENDDYGGSLDSLITARVLPGTYLIGVRQLGEGQQALTRMVFERYVQAQ